jgi:hypothetical protein
VARSRFVEGNTHSCAHDFILFENMEYLRYSFWNCQTQLTGGNLNISFDGYARGFRTKDELYSYTESLDDHSFAQLRGNCAAKGKDVLK